MLTANNPYDGTELHRYPSLDQHQLSQQIKVAHEAFPGWQALSFADRAEVLKQVAANLRDMKDELAELMALEMGKPVKEGGPEVEKAAVCCEYYAEHAEQHLQREELASDASLSYVSYEPLGTVLGILPWNAPVWLAFRCPGAYGGQYLCSMIPMCRLPVPQFSRLLSVPLRASP